MISGNKAGMTVSGSFSVVRDNIIGLDMTGKVALGNTEDGIRCLTGSDRTTFVNNTIGGNVRHGVYLSSRHHVLLGNTIGLAITGKSAVGNLIDGIHFGTGSDNATISRNIISGNLGHGAFLDSPNHVIEDNIIGLDVTGKVMVGNAMDGINSDGDNTSFTNNTISGNLRKGVDFSGNWNVFRGNIIGLDLAGETAAGNAQDGVLGVTGDDATITNNTVSGNLRHGIFLGISRRCKVQGNIIGLDVTGQVARGNAENGLVLELNSDSSTIINNTVSSNLGRGILILESSHIRIEGNRLEHNLLDAVRCATDSNFVSVINNTLSADFRPGTVGINISSESTRALANTFLSNTANTTELLVRSSVRNMPVLSVSEVSQYVFEGKTK